MSGHGLLRSGSCTRNAITPRRSSQVLINGAGSTGQCNTTDINLFRKGGVYMQRRWKLSVVQRADMWNRWKAGQSLHAIGRVLGKDHRVIRFLLARHGGIAPAARHRSQRVLTLAEREDISRSIASGCSMRFMAQCLGRACSTVSREVARHGGRAQYRANQADQ